MKAGVRECTKSLNTSKLYCSPSISESNESIVKCSKFVPST